MMKLGAVIAYVADVEETVAFWEKAFGLPRRFVTPDALYGEVGGEIPIGFANEGLPEGQFEFAPNRRNGPSAGVEITLVTEDVDAAVARALEGGAEPCVAPKDKPWGQRVAYVRDLNGILVEICTPWSPTGS